MTARPAQAAQSIRIGVLTDLSGPLRDTTGPGSVAGATLAAQEFVAANPGIAVQVIAADHQDKPDTGVAIARQWFDREGVDAITDVGNSAVALACSTLARDKDKVLLATSPGLGRPLMPRGQVPNSLHAGNYAAMGHYLKAAKAAGVEAATASGRVAVAAMKVLPTDDDCFGPGQVRVDGRTIHPNHLFQAKMPAEGRGWDDVVKLLATTPAADAFPPLSASACPLARG